MDYLLLLIMIGTAKREKVCEMDGWGKLHRNIMEWEYYQDKPVKEVFLHLNLIQHNSEVSISTLSLSEKTGFTDKQIRRAIDILISEKLIEKISSIGNRNKYKILENTLMTWF